ncbi:hypothetical protein BGZ57DRAFT_927567 [Hyaloscypha finlandica]|nr:hypothetical protein BGZ57DRAFT_927567 [Hyaloscypha finlandica]
MVNVIYILAHLLAALTSVSLAAGLNQPIAGREVSAASTAMPTTTNTTSSKGNLAFNGAICDSTQSASKVLGVVNVFSDTVQNWFNSVIFLPLDRPWNCKDLPGLSAELNWISHRQGTPSVWIYTGQHCTGFRKRLVKGDPVDVLLYNSIGLFA